VRSAVSLTLPGHVRIAVLRRALAEALELDGDDRVEVWPRALVTTGEGSLSCDIEVRSRRPIEPSEVVAIARRAAAEPAALPEALLTR
jgi:hypothetical protein